MIPTVRSLRSFLPLLLTLPLGASPQAPAPDLARTLEPALARLVQRYRLPGLAIGVVRGDTLVYSHGFGEASRGSGRPITPESIFHLASVSKLFVATAIAQLVEEKKLELDAPLTRYLPYFRLAEEESKTITLRQMLTHTAGFPDVEDYHWDAPERDAGAAERYVRSLASEHLLFAPGKGSRYSNAAFDTLGDVIAKVSGTSFEEYVAQHVFAPLGMTHSTFLADERPEALRTQGHSTFYGERVDQAPCPVYPYNRPHAPSSTLNSNVVDLCRFARANLARGALDGKRILREESYELLWAKDDDTPTIGLAWMLGQEDGVPSVSHSGRDVGFCSYLQLFPSEGVGLVVMVNSDDVPLGEIVSAIARAALGKPFTMPDRPNLSSEFAFVLERDGFETASERLFELQETEPEGWVFGFAELDAVCVELLRKRRDELAVQVAALNAELFPDEAPALVRWGEALAAAGEATEARARFERALELDPRNAAARAGLDGKTRWPR